MSSLEPTARASGVHAARRRRVISAGPAGPAQEGRMQNPSPWRGSASPRQAPKADYSATSAGRRSELSTRTFWTFGDDFSSPACVGALWPPAFRRPFRPESQASKADSSATSAGRRGGREAVGQYRNFRRAKGRPRIGRVERWRGGVGWAYLLPTLSVVGASLAQPCSVSTSRSSNRTCGFPASGSRTRFILRACAVSVALCLAFRYSFRCSAWI
jgi:hypothetical protein